MTKTFCDNCSAVIEKDELNVQIRTTVGKQLTPFESAKLRISGIGKPLPLGKEKAFVFCSVKCASEGVAKWITGHET